MVNKVILIGNVGADPDVRYLDGGVVVARFSLATTESYKNKNGERVDQTEWHNIVLWRNLAEIAEKYVKKGMKLYIEGRIRNRSWEDQNGVKRYTTEIQGDNIQMLSPKQDSGEYGNSSGSRNFETPASPSSLNTPELPDDSDDLPF
ncbi:MAG: single-stranded DNA-binding protein [Odoribacter sp.]|nr:single-stranded DNA-binding protein [Odoribacter sp.]